MSGISFSGIGSGIDTDSIIESFVYSERAPIRAMEEKVDDYSSRLSNVQGLNSKLQSLQTLMSDMSSIGEFLAYSATSTDEDAVTVTASGEATPGTYKVNVNALAQAERRYSSGFAEVDVAGAAGSGTLTIDVGGDTVDITVEATDTIEDVVNKINASGLEVTAGIFNDGTSNYIQVSGKETGVENAISITEGAGLTLGLDDATANIYQAAQDASITFDGYTVTSASNTIEDILPGVTITLNDESADDFYVKIEADPAEIQGKVEEFVSTYNDIMNMIQRDNGSDSTMRTLQMQLSSMIASEVAGLGSGFSALSQIGISTNSDSTLSLDTEELEDAINSDPQSVAKLFTGTDDDSVDGMSDMLDSLIETYVSSVDGILTAQETGINDAIRRLEDSILQAEQRVDEYEEGLRAQFTQMEVMLSELSSQSSYLSSAGF